MITLDKSRKTTISEIHGDRVPQDPWYRARYMQDNLPFDAEGRLLPDDGQDKAFTVNVEGRPMTFEPLYDERRRKDLQRKLDRLSKHLPDHDDDPASAAAAAKIEEQQEVDDVNLVDWIQGNANYEFRLIKDAITKRFAKRVQSLKEAVDFLVNDEDARIVTYAQVAPKYQVYLQKPE